MLSCFSSQFVPSPRSKSLSACFSQSDNGKRVSRVSRLQRLISTSIAPEPPAHSLQRPSRRRTTRQRARRRSQETVESFGEDTYCVRITLHSLSIIEVGGSAESYAETARPIPRTSLSPACDHHQEKTLIMGLALPVVGSTTAALSVVGLCMLVD